MQAIESSAAFPPATAITGFDDLRGNGSGVFS
jgi:hypothetical protein